VRKEKEMEEKKERGRIGTGMYQFHLLALPAAGWNELKDIKDQGHGRLVSR